MSIKNDTYEYKKVIKRPDLRISLLEIGYCTKKVLFDELKKPFNGRLYLTTDTNDFYFDWNGERHKLNVFGGGGGGGSDSDSDMSDYAKKSEIPKKVSQLTNDSGYLTIESVGDFLSNNKYVTEEMLSDQISSLMEGYVVDNDYVHTDNNFSDSDKTKLDGIDMSTKQDTLISSENIATINGNNLLEGGNIEIQGGGTSDYTQLSNKPSINGQTLEGDITISGDTVIDNTHLKDAGSDAVTKATDSMNLRARLLDVNATEEKATFTPVVGSYYNYRTDSFTESANNNYAVFNVQGKSFVRFIGLFPNIINYSSGFCFKDSNDKTLFKSGWDIDTSMDASTTKEYIAKVPEGAVTFITHVKSSGVASLESNFYCYIGTGNTVYDNLNDKLIGENEVMYGFNLISRDTVQLGRIGTKGEVISTSDYYVTPFIPLNGTTVYFKGQTAYGSSSTTNGGAIYDKNFNCVKVFRPTGSITSYTPENDYEYYIRLTLAKGYVEAGSSIAGVFYALPDGTSPNLKGMYNTITLPVTEQKYETKYTTDITVHKENVPELLPVYSSVAGSKGMTITAESLTDNRIIIPTTYPSYIKDVHTIAAKAYFEGDFPSDAWVRVGTNRNSSAGKTVQINATTIAIRSYNNSSSTYVSNISWNHSLTLKDFIMLEVNFTWNGGYIRLISSGGAYIKEWKVSDYTQAGGAEYLNYGRAYVEQNNITLSNVTLKQNSEAFKKPIWILGDSYISMYSQRWTYQLILNYKVDNFLLSGFAGATSAQMFTELQKLLNYGTPKYLVWCLGMNDGNYDATWLVTAKQIEGICSQKGIELIYQTIPQPTSGNRQLINNYIKSSGYRYVDAFSAVCKPDGTWYDGMNDDGTHPTTLGGKAIAGQFLIDLPELTHYGKPNDVTSNYTQLSNKPSINGTILEGNVTLPTMSDLDNKQDTLVSGTNIMTINHTSILGNGNINIEGSGTPVQYNKTEVDLTQVDKIQGYLSINNYTITTSSTEGIYTYLVPVQEGEHYIAYVTPDGTTTSRSNYCIIEFSQNKPAVGSTLELRSAFAAYGYASNSTPQKGRMEVVAPYDGWMAFYYNSTYNVSTLYKTDVDEYNTPEYDTYIEEDIYEKYVNTLSGSSDSKATLTKRYKLNPNINYKIIYRHYESQSSNSYTFYDDNGVVKGNSGDAGVSGTQEYRMVDLTVPEGATQIELKIIVQSATTPNSGGGQYYASGSIAVGMGALMKPLLDDGTMPQNEIVYCVSKIKKPVLSYNYTTENTTFPQNELWSAWAVRFPSGHTLSGKPTPLTSFFHGSSGYVTSERMSYPTYGITLHKEINDRGIAVFDINGFGISFQSDEYSRHWGCPAAVETVKAAYNVLTERFNCRKGMVLSGISMGGAIIKSYAMTYPEYCVACAMEAPSEMGGTFRRDGGVAEAVSTAWDGDSIELIKGYTPLALPLRINPETKNLEKIESISLVNMFNRDVIYVGPNTTGTSHYAFTVPDGVTYIVISKKIDSGSERTPDRMYKVIDSVTRTDIDFTTATVINFGISTETGKWYATSSGVSITSYVIPCVAGEVYAVEKTTGSLRVQFISELPETIQAGTAAPLVNSRENLYAPFPVESVIWHGDADVNVPLSYALTFVQTTRNAGSNVKLRFCPNCDHDLNLFPWVKDEVLNYIESKLIR